MEVVVVKDIPLDRIADLLCSALEGGSNYWYQITEFHAPPELVFRTMPEARVFRHIDYPLNEGGYLMIGDREEDTHKPVRFDLPAIHKGLQLMADKYPQHYADFLAENDDAGTGDVFLQCCLFGEIVYG